jgi:hypothetical protein
MYKLMYTSSIKNKETRGSPKSVSLSYSNPSFLTMKMRDGLSWQEKFSICLYFIISAETEIWSDKRGGLIYV